MQRKCLAGELVNPLAALTSSARAVVSAITGLPEKALVKLDDDPEWRTRYRNAKLNRVQNRSEHCAA
jgi:hypothetical protein